MINFTKYLIVFLAGFVISLLIFYNYSDTILNWVKSTAGGDIPIVTIVEPEGEANEAQEPQFSIQTLITGLSNPWDIIFLNENRIIFSERNNKINLYNNGEVKLLATLADTYVKGEGGMLGLALEPDLITYPYMYACFNSNLNGEPDVRVARLRFNESLDELIERTDILTGLPSNISGRHSGCQLEIGPDGYLWVGTGDAAEGSHPQDPQSLGGKILRIDRNGDPVPGNLNSPFDPRIYSYGHRNIQGLAFLNEVNSNGIIGFNAEHGPSTDDEVNPLVPGNFGWNPIPEYNESVPMTDTAKYPDAILATWSSGSPTLAASGLTFIEGSIWKGWEGRLALAAQKGSRVRLLQLDQRGDLIAEEDILNTYGRIRTIQQDPSYNLYILTDNGGGKDMILKLIPKE